MSSSFYSLFKVQPELKPKEGPKHKVYSCGIIPVHNHKEWLWDCVTELALQVDFLSLYDDGSTDGSLEELEKTFKNPSIQTSHGNLNFFEPTDGKTCVGPPVPVIYRQGYHAKGPAFARNRAVEQALAVFHSQTSPLECLFFCDSDDIYLDDKVKKSIEEYLQDPTIDAVYSDYYTLNESLPYSTFPLFPQYKPSFSRERLLRECIVNCDSMVSTKAFLEVGGFDESLRTCEDYDFWLRLSEKYRIVHLPELLLQIRVGHHSSSSTVSKEAWQKNYTRVFEKLKERAAKG